MPPYVSRSQYAIVLDVSRSLLCILVYHSCVDQAAGWRSEYGDIVPVAVYVRLAMLIQST